MNKTTQIILNIVAGILSFLVFMVLLFPADAAISHFLANLEKQSKGKEGWRVAVSKIDASLFFDTDFENLRVYKGKEEVFNAPKMSVGFSLFPLLFGTVNVRFKAKYSTGSISGQVVLKSESVVDVNIDQVPLDKIDFIKKYVNGTDLPVGFEGVLSGNLYYYWTGDPRNTEAEIGLKLAKAQTKAFALKDMGLDVPEIILSEGKSAIQLDAVFKSGQLTLNKFDIPGPDVNLNFSGKVKFGNNSEVARYLLDGKFSFSEKVNTKIPFIDMIKAFRAADGSFTLALRGTGKSPKLTVGDFDVCQNINCQSIFPGSAKPAAMPIEAVPPNQL